MGKNDIHYINQFCNPKGLLNELSKNIGPYSIELVKGNFIAERDNRKQETCS